MVAVQYADGILFASENPSQALHKVSEIYDRIAFAAVGRYNEFENLRIAGVRLADMRGYAYDRRDVTGRGLANAYAQTLGTIFSSGGEKPYEVELFVAEIGDAAADDQIYRLTYDGQVADEHGYAVMGGAADVVAGYLVRALPARARRSTDALALAVAALGRSTNERGEPDDRVIPVKDLEVAVLDRTRAQPRKFSRIGPFRLEALLGDRGPTESNPVEEGAEHPPGTAADRRHARRPEGPDRPGERRRTPAPGPGPDDPDRRRRPPPPAESATTGRSEIAPTPVSRPTRRVAAWTGGSSASRTSTASRARSRASAG